jgi:hypothetical protein
METLGGFPYLSLGTRVSGTVVDPAGKNPVYGALVYIPDQPDLLAGVAQGPGSSCGRCALPEGNPVAGAVTGPDGSFVLARAPAGRQIPVVVQLGKWRRMTLVDVPNPCGDNPIIDPDLARLPKSRSDEQKVSLPRIAIAAGAGDRVQCMLRRMGVDAGEFTNPDGPGSVNLYNQPSALGADPSGRYDADINHGGAVFPDANRAQPDHGCGQGRHGQVSVERRTCVWPALSRRLDQIVSTPKRPAERLAGALPAWGRHGYLASVC